MFFFFYFSVCSRCSSLRERWWLGSAGRLAALTGGGRQAAARHVVGGCVVAKVARGGPTSSRRGDNALRPAPCELSEATRIRHAATRGAVLSATDRALHHTLYSLLTAMRRQHAQLLNTKHIPWFDHVRQRGYSTKPVDPLHMMPIVSRPASIWQPWAPAIFQARKEGFSKATALHHFPTPP